MEEVLQFTYKKPTKAFKVGDRVRVKEHFVYGGREGVVVQLRKTQVWSSRLIDTYDVRIRFDGGEHLHFIALSLDSI